jgi:prolyl-tRNA synthetase
MRFSQVFLYTLRDVPADAEVRSHALLAQAGFIQKLMAGVYTYAPPMWRTLQKISQIVREELNAQGAQEAMLPILQPREIWEESTRWERYVKDGILFTLKDRKDSDACLGPTHEEVVTTMVKRAVRSYKQLPLNLYQIQTKFRDEIRPRFGLMRGREFIMKDAYSFDVDQAGLDVAYAKMRVAYTNIFRRCGLNFTIVQADAGAIGGTGGSEEFMVDAATGEDAILVCRTSGYAANVEKATSRRPAVPSRGEPKPLRRESTPGIKTVEALHGMFPDILPGQMVKTVLYVATFADKLQDVAVMMRGDRDVNEVKLANHLGALAVKLADENDVRRMTGADPGFAGPIGLRSGTRLLADRSTQGLTNFLCGANATGYHLLDVNIPRDLPQPELGDFDTAMAGDGCPISDGTLEVTRGIEVGHIFKLGTKYSEAMKATFIGEDGKEHPFVMGCYGIGVSRIAASAIEQNHDEKGMIWPLPIAPWHCEVVQVVFKDALQREIAEKLTAELEAAGVDVLYDDRNLSPGVKFGDADLIGLPYRITVGRDAAQGQVEFVERRTGTTEKLPIEAAKQRMIELVRAAR